MEEKPDWRLETNERPWMHGARLRLARYRPPTDDEWICASCFADFAGYFGWTDDDA
ncbi:MAG TPA: hypothetical protein VHF23_09770 [Gaiellaceae bacterium]|nr:hypothetical protein [Gaiellaceae bacterium]